jgi:hypothetical protein
MGLGEHINEARIAVTREMTTLKQTLARNPAAIGAEASASESSTSLLRALIGHVGEIGDYYFPPDLVGGVCPRVHGHEEAIVWNAAVEACDSERVKVVWQAAGNSIWYLAVKTSDLASNTSSWCPLAALLPKEKDLTSLPACYTYYGEELALLMVATADSLHVFRGTSAVIRAKAERLAREHGGKTGPVEVVNIDLFRIGNMTPVPWYSVSLFEDRARRIMATVSVFAALSIVALSFVVWLLASMSMVTARHDLAEANTRTKNKSMKLMTDAENVRSSPMREQLQRFLAVNEGLLNLNGFLTVYEIKDNVTRWKAVVPPSATADRISAMGGKSMETTEKGVVIGNDAQIQYEVMNRKKR